MQLILRLHFTGMIDISKYFVTFTLNYTQFLRDSQFWHLCLETLCYNGITKVLYDTYC